MTRVLLFALTLLAGTLPQARAADSESTDAAVQRQFNQFDKLVARYKVAYADAERLIQAGPRVITSTSAAALPAAQEKLRLDEELVRRDREMLSELPKLSSGPAVKPTPEIDAGACAKDFSYDKMLSSYGTGWSVDQITDQQHMLFNVVLYQICSDVASRAPGLCASSSPIFDVRPKQPGPPKPDHSEDSSYRDECLRGAANARLIAAAAKGPEAFEEACKPALAEMFEPGKAGEGCGAVAASFDDPAAAAAKIKPLLKDRSIPTAKLAGDIAMIVGKATGAQCGAKKDDGFGINAELCIASSALRRARAAGGSAGCGASAVCKALMGGGVAACQPYAAAARSLYCTRSLTVSSKDEPKSGGKTAKVSQERNLVMEKLKADETSLGRERDFVKSLQAAASSSQRQVEFMSAVSARRKELRGMIDEAFRLIDSVEPKSHSGIAERRDQIDDLQQDLDALTSPSVGATQPKRSRRKTHRGGGAPKTQ